MLNNFLLLSLAAAIGYGVTAPSPPSLLRAITKTSALGWLVVLSIKLNAPILLIAAQVSSAIGDALLVWEDDAHFLGGLGSFLSAHLFYTTFFLKSGGGLEALSSESWRKILAIGIFCFDFVVCIFILVPKAPKELRVPIMFYSMAIYAMLVTALTTMNHDVLLGAISFMVSDTILAMQRFVVHKTSSLHIWMEYAIWALYYLGQVWIMQGFTGLFKA